MESIKPFIVRSEYDGKIVAKVIAGNSYDLIPNLDDFSVIDIGAHLGSFSYACLERGATHVWAFEAHPELSVICHENLKAFGDDKVVMVENLAVWNGDIPNTLKMSQTIDGNSGTGSALFAPNDSATEWEAETIAFDDIIKGWVQEFGFVDLVKMDCEGAEYPILYNSNMLDFIGNIVLEYHEPNLNLRMDSGINRGKMTGKSVALYLRECGFSIVGKPMTNTGIIWASKNGAKNAFRCFEGEDE